MAKIIGIDLGTTNSVISVMENGGIKVIPNAQGNSTTPSVVAYTKDQILVGVPAKNQAVTNPTGTVSSVKRIMGQRIGETSVSSFAKTVPYTLSGEKGNNVKIQIGEKTILPQEISAKVLRELKKCAEDYLGEPVVDAVITVPAYFNDSQRQATKDAGAIAGLNVRRIINEPTAAALAFGFKQSDDDTTIAVFDLGGGTFDISILEIGGGVLEVKATNGNTYLGGDDFDQAIISSLLRDFKKENGVDLSKDPSAMGRLKEAAEKAKCELSSTLISTINLPFVASKDGSPLHLTTDFSRTKFETLIKPFLSKVEKCCKQALTDAKLTPGQLHHVLLVGGSTRVPLVQDLVRKVFGKEPNKSVNPDEVVAKGAAIQGAIISGSETSMVLLDITPLSLGIETAGEEMDVLISRNTTIPVSTTEVYTTQDDDQDAVDVYIYQGEHKRATKNRLLGHFELEGIEPSDAGDPQIQVSFDIDVNGILLVSARDLDTGKEQRVRIENSSALNQTEIEKMRGEAEQSIEEDRQYLAIKQLMLTAETYLEQTESGVEEFAEILSEEEAEGLKLASDQLRSAYDAQNMDRLKEAIDDISAVWKYILEKQHG